jgi:pantetheine-phosphate adenylyltransferase
MTIAVCPGSFDPITSGHIDVIERCTNLFTTVHVVVAINALKTPIFGAPQRVEMIAQALENDGYRVGGNGSGAQIVVSSTAGLITDYCAQVGATVIVKGLRQNGDYEAELGMALANRKIGGIETLFIPADPIKEHISSSIVKDIARHGGDIRGMVPDSVVGPLLKALAVDTPNRAIAE